MLYPTYGVIFVRGYGDVLGVTHEQFLQYVRNTKTTTQAQDSA